MTDPWPGMEILALDGESVTTTGARWSFDADGSIHADQRVGCARPLLRLRVPPGRFTVEGPRFVRDDLVATVRDDAVVVFCAARPTEIGIEPLFPPDHVARHRGRFLALDDVGGCGVFPLRPRLRTSLRRVRLAVGDEVWIGAFPPRHPSVLRQSQEIAHEGRPTRFPEGAHPSSELIADAARHCHVFALHAYFWAACEPGDRPRIGRYAGRRCSWRTRRHAPACPERFAAVRDAVRASGMEFVVYLSPQHSRATDLCAEMQRVVDEYGVDGLYLDGVARDLPTLDRVVRSARAILGPRRVLYLNATDQPFGTPRVYAPFVDARCDFVLRGDAGRGGLARDTFLRRAVSGRAISNAVGVWCHYGSSGRPVLREQAPGADDVRAAVRAGARLWRRAQAWGEPGAPAGSDIAAFDTAYAAARAANVHVRFG